MRVLKLQTLTINVEQIAAIVPREHFSVSAVTFQGPYVPQGGSLLYTSGGNEIPLSAEDATEVSRAMDELDAEMRDALEEVKATTPNPVAH